MFSAARKSLLLTGAFSALVASAAIPLLPAATEAASHREAPLISLDPTADITDFFLFRSYEPGKSDKAVLLMNVMPGEDPSSGPNYWNFDPNVRYTFNIDNDQDGVADDVKFEFQFRTNIRGVPESLKLPLSYVALPPISALEGSGSEGLGLRQRYSVTMTKNGQARRIANDLLVVPSNVGPRTTPNYPSLAQQGIYQLQEGPRVFAGQRQDPFYIDLGGVFDTLNLRRSPLPLLTAAEDANDNANPFGINTLNTVGVHTIALEVPISWITKDGKGASATNFPKLGAYASTSRRAVTVLDLYGNPRGSSNDFVQVQRLANPLVNELIIGTEDKDRWNATEPEDESSFLDFYLNSRLAIALETVYNVPAEKTNRTDLRDLLLKYKPSDSRLSELLRLDLKVAPRPLGQQRRMGPLATNAGGTATPDPAAWPNGRRPIDDVTDIAIRVVGGANYIQGRAGDGVNVDDAALTTAFPFLATPFDGRDRDAAP